MSVFRRTAGLVTICVVFSLGAAACAKKPPVATPTAPAAVVTPPTAPLAPPPPPPPPPVPPASVSLSEDELFARKTLDQLNAERPLADAFFDLDQSTLRDDARGPMQQNAEWLKRWPSTRVAIEGHADERGSAEYNLALGDRRGTAVRDYLVGLGVPSGRMGVVSLGKEAQFCTESTEACWQQNRRGHFVITLK